jgi:hypothetical protein
VAAELGVTVSQHATDSNPCSSENGSTRSFSRSAAVIGVGPIRIVCRGWVAEPLYSTMERSPKMTANCALAAAASRGDIFHCRLTWHNTRKSSLVVASSFRK